MKTVHFVRHGETEENNKGVWQGHSETTLNKKGFEQAKLLAERFQKDSFKVFTSDLLRAKETAKFLSDTYESRENLREINVGDFAGKSVKETYSDNSEIFTALQDDSYAFPNGETVREFKNRVKSELDYIFDKTEENSTTIVVTHGFFIGTVIGIVMGFSEYPFPIGNIQNTAISTVIKRDSLMQVNKFNDALHTSNSYIDFPAKEKNNVVTFIRHGQTDSNVGGIWQGHIDNPLNKVGIETANKLKNTFSHYESYLSSPYKRAYETMKIISSLENIETSDLLTEMNLGEWEGLSTSQIMENYRDSFIDALFINHKTKYGVNGESIFEAGKRIESLLNQLKESRILLASHGGTIKAGITKLISPPGDKAASSFTIPNNLGVSCLVYENNKYYLWSYNVGQIGYENFSYNK